MMGRTHAVAGCSAWISVATVAHASPMVVAGGGWLAGLAAGAPDLDLVLGMWAHRKATHSAVGLGLFAGTLGLLAGSIHLPAAVLLAATVGYASHLLTDALTAHGIPLWWPDPRCLHLLPERWRISTGGRRYTDRKGKQRRGAPVGEVLVSGASIAVAVLCVLATHRALAGGR